MPVDIIIPDEALNGFSPEAQDRLKQSVTKYAEQVITEANRIEAGRNAANGPPEVTKSMVHDATHLLERGLGVPKINWTSKLLRVGAAICSISVGFLYDQDKLQGPGYMIVFTIVLTVTVVTITASVFKD